MNVAPPNETPPSSPLPQSTQQPPTHQQSANNDTEENDREYNENDNDQQFTNQQAPMYYPPQPEELLLEWQAPSRPFKKRNRQYYVTIALIIFLISLILFFAGQFLPIAVAIAAGFMWYVLSAVPPEIITNKITTYGIRTEQSLFYWEELGRFWLDEKYKQKLIHVEVGRFPNQLTLLLGDQDEEEITDLLSRVLLQEKPPLTSFDKAANWLQEKIPLDTDK